MDRRIVRLALKSGRARGGFTLLEILLVITLAAVLMAIAMPSMARLVRRDSAGALAVQVARMFASARAKAAGAGAPCAVVLDVAKKSLSLEVQVSDAKSYGRWTPVPGPDAHLSLPAQAILDWPQPPAAGAAATPSPATPPTSATPAIAGSAAGPYTPGNAPAPRLVFSPRLSSDGIDVTITQHGESARVHVDAITGRATVSELGGVPQ